MISLLGFFVIFNFWFVRMQKESLQIVVLFGIVLCWVYYKILNAIILTQFKIPITVFLTKAIFPLKLVDMILSDRGFFCCRRFKVTKAVSMCSLWSYIIVVNVISVEPYFFIFTDRIRFLVEREVVLFDRVGNFRVEGGRFVFGEPFFLGNFRVGLHAMTVLSEDYQIYNSYCIKTLVD